MYCDYWGLTKPPFDNVPDASMYVDCHESMENVISETIFAIKEGNECLTVIVGEVGLGKTLSLRVIIDSLEPEKYKVALITNPALSFVQLLREIIGQITGKQCEVKNKVDLQEIFNRLLFETADQGKKIVIVIDEANVLSSSNLDDLRLLTNMQDDERNLFTLLLVGQMEFARTLEHPKRANLFQRIGTYGHLEKLPSPEAVRTYIESRLKIAGTTRKIFDDDAIPVIWEFSEHGVPRLINKICKLCIKAGETNEFATISGEVAQQIADRFQKLSKTSAPKRKAIPEAQPAEEGMKKRETEKIPKPSIPRKEEMDIKPPVRPAPPMEEPMPPRPRAVTPEPPPMRPAPPRMEEPIAPPPKFVAPEPPPARPLPPTEEPMPARPRAVMPEPPPARPAPPPAEESAPVGPRTVMPEPPPVRPAPPRMEEPVISQPNVVTPEPPPVRPLPPMEETISPRPRAVMPETPPVRPAPPRMEEPVISQPNVVTPEPPPVRPLPPMEETISPRPRAVMPETPPVRPAPPRMEEPVISQPNVVTPEPPPVRPLPPMEETISPRPRAVMPETPPARPAPPSMEGPAPVRPRAVMPEQPPARPAPPRMEEPIPIRPKVVVQEPPQTKPLPPVEETVPAQPSRTVPLTAKPAVGVVPPAGSSTPGVTPTGAAAPRPMKPSAVEQPAAAAEEKEDYEDVFIGQHKIKLAIPSHVIRQAQLSSNENKNKLAGYWSAQILKANPSLTHLSIADPVSMWFEVKNVILKKFNSPPNANVTMQR